MVQTAISQLLTAKALVQSQGSSYSGPRSTRDDIPFLTVSVPSFNFFVHLVFDFIQRDINVKEVNGFKAVT
jgi:hypothetical protein